MSVKIHPRVTDWAHQMKGITGANKVIMLDGSPAQRSRLNQALVKSGAFQALDPAKWPNSYASRSAPTDTARAEDKTLMVYSENRDNNRSFKYMSPDAAHSDVLPLFKNAMNGRDMFVVPALMGPEGSSLSRALVQVTDSPYVAANMAIMSRMGDPALRHINENNGVFTRGLHASADLDYSKLYVLHFPEGDPIADIWSVNSAYGGNALQGKKCLALRLAMTQARAEGWLAEHMLILKIKDPSGKTHYLTAAFPSACGKTNLAMLNPPTHFAQQGWEITTLGDDIAWLKPHSDGTLHAINPENGMFGVAPGTNDQTNGNMMDTLRRGNVIFTNVATTPDGDVWWEGLTPRPPKQFHDWRNREWEQIGSNTWAIDRQVKVEWNEGRGSWKVTSGEEFLPDALQGAKELPNAAHPNSRFTVAASQCPSLAQEWENPDGVPISLTLFGGRRPEFGLIPLVSAAQSWEQAVYMATVMGSAMTAAAFGAVGDIRRDAFAQLPFMGYPLPDYLRHWLSMPQSVRHLPQVATVNWFQRDDEGRFIWHGYGDNFRALEWLIRLGEGSAPYLDSPVGRLPGINGLDMTGYNMPEKHLAALTTFNPEAGWPAEADSRARHLAKYPDMPEAVTNEQKKLAGAINSF